MNAAAAHIVCRSRARLFFLLMCGMHNRFPTDTIAAPVELEASGRRAADSLVTAGLALGPCMTWTGKRAPWDRYCL